MYASSRNKSNVPPLSTCHRSPSPSSTSSSTFASSSFSSRSSTFFTRATSPTRVTSHYYYDTTTTTTTTTTTPTPRSSSSVRFSTDRPISPGRSISFRRQNNNNNKNTTTTTTTSNAVPFNKKRTCACSPTTHPGSYRCGLHRNLHNRNQTVVSYHSSSRLNCRRSAMTNSLVRIGGVEGELVKRALTALIRPSSHQQRRRAAFEPRPSRLSKMAKADDHSLIS